MSSAAGSFLRMKYRTNIRRELRYTPGRAVLGPSPERLEVAMVPVVLEVVATIAIVLSLVFVSLVVLPARRTDRAPTRATPGTGHAAAQDVRTGS